MTFDPKSRELAEHFLVDGADPKLIDELAEWIQFNVELWFTDRNDDGTWRFCR
jgi:hypothetical protein